MNGRKFLQNLCGQKFVSIEVPGELRGHRRKFVREMKAFVNFGDRCAEAFAKES